MDLTLASQGRPATLPEARQEARARRLRSVFSFLTYDALTLFGSLLVAGLILVALLAPYIAPYDPIVPNLAMKLTSPSMQHLFGTDEMGRDILSRIIIGSRLSLWVATVVVILAGGLGTLLGALAGFNEAWVDEAIMRVTDIFLTFPALVLAMAIAVGMGPSVTSGMIAISLVWWPVYARLVRAQVLSIKHEPYIEAARSIGASKRRILLRHVLPNAIWPVVASLTFDMGYAILLTASLGFIGLGAQPPTPEWGAMVAIGRNYILGHWWYATFPGLAILLSVLGFSLLGDGLQRWADPTLRRGLRHISRTT